MYTGEKSKSSHIQGEDFEMSRIQGEWFAPYTGRFNTSPIQGRAMVFVYREATRSSP